MHYWKTFWAVSVLISGLSFAFVTVVVTLKGVRDLRNMFANLLKQRGDEESGMTSDSQVPDQECALDISSKSDGI